MPSVETDPIGGFFVALCFRSSLVFEQNSFLQLQFLIIVYTKQKGKFDRTCISLCSLIFVMKSLEKMCKYANKYCRSLLQKARIKKSVMVMVTTSNVVKFVCYYYRRKEEKIKQ